MVIFGIPLVARSVCRDWSKVMYHLSATIASLQSQTSESTHIIVAGTDRPDIDIPFSDSLEFIGCPNLAEPDDYQAKRRDGMAKRFAAATRARELGGGYLMFVDADDLVSHKLASFIEDDAHPNGYLVSKGYVFDVSSGQIAPYPPDGRERRFFDRFCGTSVIVHATPDELPKHGNDDTRLTRLFWNNEHALVRPLAFKEGRPLANVPFRAVVYVKGPENQSSTATSATVVDHHTTVVSEIPQDAIERTAELENEFGLSATEGYVRTR